MEQYEDIAKGAAEAASRRLAGLRTTWGAADAGRASRDMIRETGQELEALAERYIAENGITEEERIEGIREINRALVGQLTADYDGRNA